MAIALSQTLPKSESFPMLWKRQITKCPRLAGCEASDQLGEKLELPEPAGFLPLDLQVLPLKGELVRSCASQGHSCGSVCECMLAAQGSACRTCQQRHSLCPPKEQRWKSWVLAFATHTGLRGSATTRCAVPWFLLSPQQPQAHT